MSAEGFAARRCGKITDPGSLYPHPCVLPEGHDGACDPVPNLLRFDLWPITGRFETEPKS